MTGYTTQGVCQTEKGGVDMLTRGFQALSPEG